MIKRVIPILLVVAALVGAIMYSKYRPTPDRVSGFIEADEIRLGSRVGGRVREVLVAEGSTVEPGQTLIQLEPFDLLAEQQKAKALSRWENEGGARAKKRTNRWRGLNPAPRSATGEADRHQRPVGQRSANE